MNGPDYRQQEELEQERRSVNAAIYQKLQRARRDGYLTDRDLTDLKHELGVDDEQPENTANQ